MTDYHFLTVHWDECSWSTSYHLTVVKAKDEIQVSNWWNSLPANDRPFCPFTYYTCEDERREGCLNPEDCINKCGGGMWLSTELERLNFVDKEGGSVESMIEEHEPIEEATVSQINNRISRIIPNVVSLLKSRKEEEYYQFSGWETYFLGTTKDECLKTLKGIFDFGNMSKDWAESVMEHRPLVRHASNYDIEKGYDYEYTDECVGKCRILKFNIVDRF